MSPEQLAQWQSRLYEQLLEGELDFEGLPPPARDLLESAEAPAKATAVDLARRWCKLDLPPEGGPDRPGSRDEGS